MIKSSTRLATLGLLTFALVGCETGTGPESDSETRVLLARGTVASSSLSAAVLEADPVFARFAALGPVALSKVASIDVTITRVDALPAAEDSETEAGWVSLDVTQGGSVNLLSLPMASEEGLTLARAELPVGTYGNLRFFLQDATITFNEPVTVGTHTFAANEKIPLFIPSGAQTGLKTNVVFNVAEGDADDVKLIFDATASVEKIVATGAGTIILPPVMVARAVE